MQRVMVIGPCGAGKSTLSFKLANCLQLPLFHMDKLGWRAHWIEAPKDETLRDLEEILQQDSWLIDGNYGSTMPHRISKADLIVYLDYPILLCFWRVLKRTWKGHATVRPDMSEGCPERFDLDFLLYILAWNWGPRVHTENALKGSEDKLIRLKNPKTLALWLDALHSGTKATAA